jgi:preprotein translocase subunit SecD
MKRLPLLVTLFLLTACRTTLAAYELQIDMEDEARRTALVSASMRVIERRLESIGEEPAEKDVDIQDQTVRMILRVANDTIRDILTDQLVAPFTLRIMREAKEDSEGATIVEGHGAFEESGVMEQHLFWITAGIDQETNKSKVTLEFTPDGRNLMGKLFKENKGKYIGLFVRNRLVSKLLVETAELKDDIIITDIPTAELAGIFADDVNVGLHVKFVPVE